MRVVVEVQIGEPGEPPQDDLLTATVAETAEVVALLGASSAVVVQVVGGYAIVRCEYGSLEDMVAALADGTSGE